MKFQAYTEEELEAEYKAIQQIVKKAGTHAAMARSIVNKNRDKMDVCDQAETFALVSISESLSSLNRLLFMMMEV